MTPPDEPEVAFIRTIAEALCDRPEDITIERTTDERGVLVMLYVAQEDIGRIIGKKGECATAIRLLLRALGSRIDARLSFKVNTAK